MQVTNKKIFFEVVTNLQKFFPVYLSKKICIQVDLYSPNSCCSRVNCNYIKRYGKIYIKLLTQVSFMEGTEAGVGALQWLFVSWFEIFAAKI